MMSKHWIWILSFCIFVLLSCSPTYMTPAQIKESQERTFRIVVSVLVTPVIGVVSYLLLLKNPMHDKNSHEKKKNVPPMSVAEKVDRVITALGWVFSGMIGWAICLMFSSVFSSLIPYPTTEQTTIPARFLFTAIWGAITFVIWTVVWHIAYYILERAGLSNKNKKAPLQP
jgi:hypothetical protein